MRYIVSRRAFVSGGILAAAPVAVIRGRARAAQFEYSHAHDVPFSSPMHIRSVQMWQQVEHETGGRLLVRVFGNGSLGSSEGVMTQVRAGAIQFASVGSQSATELLPTSAIMGVGFAFRNDAAAMAAIDGALGDAIRREMETRGLVSIAKETFEVGLRQFSSNGRAIQTPPDMVGLKMRIAPARLTVDLFRTLGATPTAVNLTQIYSALQTHLVDGTDLPVSLILGTHVFEVQKYLGIANHTWGGYFLVGNPGAWNALPPDIRAIVQRNCSRYIGIERRDMNNLEPSLIDKLEKGGVQVSRVEPEPFRAKLAPYYARCKAEFGPALWSLLEQYSGGKLG